MHTFKIFGSISLLRTTCPISHTISKLAIFPGTVQAFSKSSIYDMFCPCLTEITNCPFFLDSPSFEDHSYCFDICNTLPQYSSVFQHVAVSCLFPGHGGSQGGPGVSRGQEEASGPLKPSKLFGKPMKIDSSGPLDQKVSWRPVSNNWTNENQPCVDRSMYLIFLEFQLFCFQNSNNPILQQNSNVQFVPTDMPSDILDFTILNNSFS